MSLIKVNCRLFQQADISPGHTLQLVFIIWKAPGLIHCLLIKLPWLVRAQGKKRAVYPAFVFENWVYLGK